MGGGSLAPGEFNPGADDEHLGDGFEAGLALEKEYDEKLASLAEAAVNAQMVVEEATRAYEGAKQNVAAARGEMGVQRSEDPELVRLGEARDLIRSVRMLVGKALEDKGTAKKELERLLTDGRAGHTKFLTPEEVKVIADNVARAGGWSTEGAGAVEGSA